MLQAGGGAHRPETSTSSSASSREQAYKTRMGDRGYARFEALKRSERQRGTSVNSSSLTAAVAGHSCIAENVHRHIKHMHIKQYHVHVSVLHSLASMEGACRWVLCNCSAVLPDFLSCLISSASMLCAVLNARSMGQHAIHRSQTVRGGYHAFLVQAGVVRSRGSTHKHMVEAAGAVSIQAGR